MSYYKTISLIALVILIICLAIIGTAMASSKDVLYPPYISDCPDFYVKQSDGKCKDVKGIAGTNNTDCTSEDFSADDYNMPGMGKSSGLCAKKKWATSCQVNWDGITNNSLVCYKEIS